MKSLVAILPGNERTKISEKCRQMFAAFSPLLSDFLTGHGEICPPHG